MLKRKAIKAINTCGALLVYPLCNKKEPRSLWSELYPRSRMRWEWDADGDNRVAGLWHLREQLSRSREVIYVKWFQNRATFFSKETFTNLLSALNAPDFTEQAFSPDSRQVLELLTSDSPLSTKQLKAATELEGRLLEPTYNRALKPLWRRMLLVGFGEFEDSSFPSLGIGATKTLFEDLWLEAARRKPEKAWDQLEKGLGSDNPFFKFARRVARDVPSHCS